ncbi:MAG: M48 family metallopeptidase [Candidatus Omnitrophota bacterium]
MQKHADIEGAGTLPEAKKYQAIKNRLFLLSIFLNLCFFILVIVFGWSKALSAGLSAFTDNFFLHNALYFTCFSFVYCILFFPLDFYEGYFLEHRFGLSRQTLGAWGKDVFKKSLVTFFISLIVLEAVYFFLAKSPVLWWLWAAFFWFLVSIVLTKIFPKVILPLFYKSRPLEEGVLRARIFNLLEKYGVCLKDVFILDFSKKTVKANAMVVGLGRTKQIYFSDTLVNDFTQSEIEVVLAHELGHFVHKDTFKLSVLSLVLAFFSFYSANVILNLFLHELGFSSICDIAAFPFFLMIIMWAGLAVLPLQNAYSRLLEKKADLFALEATGSPEVFISMMKRLGEKNFAEFSPSKIAEIFLYSHPPINKRIAYALEFLKSQENKNAS